eukprot:jgi/Phyca11/551160/estExt2_Genewise1Plus.C_PHYCAscaffold_400312
MEPSPPLDGALPSRRPLRLAPPAPTTNLVATSRKVPIATVNSLLSKRILSVESFRRERLERLRLPNKVPPLSKAIPMPLYPGETPQQYNYKFQQWLAKRKESLETLADDPKRERKLWLTFAFFREKPSAREKLPAPRAPKRSINEEYEDFYQRSASQEIKLPQAISSEANIAAERSSSKSLCNSDKLPHSKKKKPVEPSQEKPPSWALLLINRVEELEAKVTRLQHQINKLSEMVDVEIKSKPGKMKNEAAPQPTYEEIHREATRNLARAVQSRTHEDSKQQKLAEAYDHLNEQISMNETAIDDALDYIKAIKDIDEAKANEQHSQIMELVVSINTEKERRASALAALIVHNFAERQNMLKTLLEETPSARTTNGVSHGKLGTISSQIEERESVLETLKVHLNEQLDWVTGIPPCVSEPDKALRFKALRKMSKKVAKEQEAKERLLQEREEILKEFVQQDNEIRKLVKESLQKVS